jgi:hypothetical protein
MARGMPVVHGVGMQMVVPMHSGPPQHTLLRGCLSRDGKHELERAAGRIGSVREIAVISSSYGKDAQPIKSNADRQGFPSDTTPNRPDACHMY